MVANTVGTGCAVVGIGETEFLRYSDRGGLDLACEAIAAALADAGLSVSDVDGIVRGYSDSTTFAPELVTYLDIPDLAYFSDAGYGGAGAVGAIVHALAALRAGLATTVVCYRAQANQTDGAPAPGSHQLHPRMLTQALEFEAPFGLFGEHAAFALQFRRHMALYGTTTRQLGHVAVALRNHARLNPKALERGPLSLAEYLAEDIALDPLRLVDFGGQVRIHGASAVVMTTAERARDLRRRPVDVLGATQGTGPRPTEKLHLADLTGSFHGYVAPRLFASCEVAPADVDVAELYDPNTVQVLLQLEDYGFCARGEAGSFVENGGIEVGGRLPVTTHGGSHSEGYMQGFNGVLEAVKQLRGVCGPRQVAGAEVALVTGSDATSAAAAILRRG